MEAGDESAAEDDRPQRQERNERFSRERRPRRDDREDRGGRESSGRGNNQANGASETISFDVLPPAIGRDDEAAETAEAVEEEPRRPRRRTTRAPRPADGDEEIAPAA